MGADNIILAIIIGTLAAIVYSLRVLVLLERRIARMDYHLEKITMKILQEDYKIEKEEEQILKLKTAKKKTAKRSVKKTTKKTAKKKR